MPPYFRLFDIIQPKLNIQNPNYNGSSRIFCYGVDYMLNYLDMQSFFPTLSKFSRRTTFEIDF